MTQTIRPKPVFSAEQRVRERFLDKILGRKPSVNAIIDLTNLLANRPLLQITEQEVQNISRHYKVDLYKEFAPKLRQLYATFLQHCLADHKLSNEEIVQLKKLKSILSLRNTDIGSIHFQVAGRIYSKSFAEALKDGRLEQHEKDFLNRLEKELRLSEKLAEKISTDLKKSYVADYVNKIQEDNRVSPDELQELEAISTSLSIEVAIDSRTRATLDRMKWYWVIENGELPAVDVELNLSPGEVCYYKTNSKLNELKAGVKYGGGSNENSSDKIVKGVPYKVGSTAVPRLKPEELQLVDTGVLYITNRRLIFSGEKNTSFRLDKVLWATPYADGLGLDNPSGSPTVFTVSYNADVLSMMISRVINDL